MIGRGYTVLCLEPAANNLVTMDKKILVTGLVVGP